MVIKSIHVKNFRSVLDESLFCDCLTALVGRNGAGKSSFLRALELFYDPGAKVTAEDFYAENTGPDIEIAVSFSELTPQETEFFSAYIDGDTLTVARVFSLTPGKKSGTYHGMRLQNPAFAAVRNAGGKREILNQYKELRSQQEYTNLPAVTKGDDALVRETRASSSDSPGSGKVIWADLPASYAFRQSGMPLTMLPRARDRASLRS
jgi:putative ATP-dependent endonuclease of OLD family